MPPKLEIYSYKISNLEKFENDIKFIIIMATFNRKNGKTPSYLERSLESIMKQKYTNWDLIIVGDKYEPENELTTIINKYKNKTKNNIYYLNNISVERDFVTNNLWNCAGATSMNVGLNFARKKGYKYYCHLDDDDYWTDEHLSSLIEAYGKYPSCIFANTKSTHVGSYLPNEDMEIYENNRLPIPMGTIHSSFSFRIDILPFYYLTSLTENGVDTPSDANMLGKIKQFLEENKMYSSIYVSKLTCYHDIEGQS